jgi:hypothetical protein
VPESEVGESLVPLSWPPIDDETQWGVSEGAKKQSRPVRISLGEYHRKNLGGSGSVRKASEESWKGLEASTQPVSEELVILGGVDTCLARNQSVKSWGALAYNVHYLYMSRTVTRIPWTERSRDRGTVTPLCDHH